MSDAAAVPDNDGLRPDPAGGGRFPSIIIQGAAIARIEAEMGGDTGSEVGGVLVGNAAPSTNFVLITGSLPAPQLVAEQGVVAIDSDGSGADGSGATVADPAGQQMFTLTAAVLEDLARQVAAAYPGQRIVGWYHSHPRFGIFLSAHDLYIQSAFFAQSWQIGYVYDPIQAQRGFFGWSDREVVRVPNWEVTSVAHASGADLPVNSPERSAPVDGDFAAASPFVIGGVEPTGYASVSATSPATSAAPDGPSLAAPKKKRPIGMIVAAAAAVIAIVIAAIALTGGDDEDPSITSSAPDTSTIVTDGSTGSTESSVETTTAETQPDTVLDSSTTLASGDVTTTEPVAITFPATPTAVAAAASRVGTGAVACAPEADGSYAPLADCFVPLNNGNVLAFVSGSLRCVDPEGQVVANEAQKFTVGVDGDPIVLQVEDALNATCLDLSYAKNILTGGSDTFDGLCGSSGTQINDGTRRCLAQNLTTGAMVALVRSSQNQGNLVASCKASSGDAVLAEIDWSDNSVGTSWRVDSVVYQPASNNFIASASRTGAEATATVNCG